MATILHLITGLETGGAELMLARLVSRLDPTRHRSVVVSMTGPGALSVALADAGIEVFTLGVPRGWPDPRGFARLAGILRRVRPAVVQTWLYHADFLGLLGRWAAPAPCRLFWNIQCTETADSQVVRRLLAWSSRAPDVVIVNSLAGRRFHETLGYRPRQWVHIPNGCDTTAFRFDANGRHSLRDELGIADDSVAIGLPARYHPMKDHGNFLAAAALLAEERPEVVFVLAGSGADAQNQALVRAVDAHGLVGRIRLLGNRDDMVRVYSALDIATLASAFGEGCPNVLVEAMSCEVACVATDCGDAVELLGAGGLVVPRRDPRALAAAWRRLFDLGRCGRRSVGREARKRIVETYDLKTVVSQYEALYS